MTDILDDAREMLAEITDLRRAQTLYDNCRRVHTACLIAEMIREIERLRLADAEREAIVTALAFLREEADDPGVAQDIATLRGLLERAKCHTVGE